MRPLKQICSIKKEENNPGDAEECLLMRNEKQPQKIPGHPSQGARRCGVCDGEEWADVE